ncbi:MAG: efflux transporter outer membrane subunit [Pirellulaceae bacterium]
MHSPSHSVRPTAICLLLCCVFAISGCKVGPNFSKQRTDYLNHAWADQGNPRFEGQLIDERLWWHVFQDPILDELIENALANNLDLQQAGQRILEARALRQVAAGNLFPQQQTGNAGYNRIRISENTANFVTVPGFFETTTTYNSFNSNFSAAWELDFWGKYRRIVEAAEADVGSAMAAYDLAKVLLIGEVARSYIDLRTIEQRIMLAQRNIEIQRATLELTEARLEAGTAVKLDYHQSKANLAQTEAVLPTLELLRRQANHQLCVLLGQVPLDKFSHGPAFGNIPQPPPAIAIGIPNDLLRRRPDIQIAECQLAAQCARIGIAQADFYPQLSLVGTIGVSAQSASDLFRPSSLVGVTGPSASWNLLNYGRIKNHVIAEQQAFERLRLAYHETVLKAYKEAQDSHVAFINYWERMESLRVAADNSAAAVHISQVAFAEGATDFNRVYLLQSELVRNQDAAAENQGKIAQSLVDLYVAMGGGWEISGSPCRSLYASTAQPLYRNEFTYSLPPTTNTGHLPPGNGQANVVFVAPSYASQVAPPLYR